MRTIFYIAARYTLRSLMRVAEHLTAGRSVCQAADSAIHAPARLLRRNSRLIFDQIPIGHGS